MPASDPGHAPTLFITRKFPPQVGGMETLAAAIWQALQRAEPGAQLVAHRGTVPATLGWLPGAVSELVRAVRSGSVGAVLCGDVALYAVIGPFLRRTGTPHVVMAMGLDVTYDHPVYRALALPGLRRAPRVLAISRATARSVIDVGVPPERVGVLPLGIPVPATATGAASEARRRVLARLDLAEDTDLLVSVGRLVPRKGVAWFVEHVLPALPATAHLVVAGDGADRERISLAASAAGVDDRLHLMGRVADDLRDDLMVGADVFVQPNVVVPGDMEGFGLVAVEAAMSGTVVVASDLEGLGDAVEDGVTGHLVTSGDVDAWVDELTRLLSDRDGLARTAGGFRQASIERNSIDVMEAELERQLDATRSGSTMQTTDDRTYYETSYHFEQDVEDPGAERLWKAIRLLGPMDGRTFLDLGSGVGWAAALAVERSGAATAVGIDFAFKALQLGQATVPGVLRVHGDGTRLPLQTASVDRVLSFGSLEHFPDVDAGLAELRRVLAPGGRVVVVVPNFFARTEQPRELRLSRRGWNSHFERAGLRIVHTSADAGPPVLRDRRPLRMLLRAGAKAGALLPGGQYQFIFVLEPHAG